MAHSGPLFVSLSLSLFPKDQKHRLDTQTIHGVNVQTSNNNNWQTQAAEEAGENILSSVTKSREGPKTHIHRVVFLD